MAGGSNVTKLTSLNQALGVDLRSSEALRPSGYMAAMENCVYNKANLFEKRPGYKAIAVGSGGFGCGKLNIYDSASGSITPRFVSLSGDGLKYLQSVTLTVTYSSTSTCQASLYFDPTSTAYKFKIVEGSTTKIDQSLGLGFDESSPYTVASLATAISAISGGNFVASTSGTSSTPAALLELTNSAVFTSSAPFTIKAYYWTTAYSPVSGLLDWFVQNQNTDAYSNSVPVPYRRALFFPNPGSFGLLKYDGHALYRAGVPSVNSLLLTEISGASAVAEVTSITCHNADGTAQQETVLVNAADAGAKEVFTINFSRGYPGGPIYMLTADNAGSVAIVFKHQASDTTPTTGAARNIIVITTSSAGSGGATQIATDFQSQVDADAQFVAVRTGNLVTVAQASAGTRTDAAYGTMSPAVATLTTTTQGANGYATKYFDIYESATSRVSVWLNSGADTAPVTGAARYISATYTPGATAANVAEAIKLAVDADASFAASRSTATVTITHSTAGYHGTAVDGNTGFTITKTVTGVNSLAGRYFVSDDTNGSVLWWFNYNGATQPGVSANRYVAITTVADGQNASTVSGHVKDAIDADAQYSATNGSPPVVVMTDSASGARVDAFDGDTGFTISVTTQGISGGLGAATFKYKITVIHRDNIGVEIEGNATASTITLSDGTKDTQLTIGGIQADSGYNTGCAIVNGGQGPVTTINVDSGHTIQPGDTAYLFNGVTYIESLVASTTSTSITIADTVTVLDDAVISSGLRIAIYRTIGGGFQWFNVAIIPNDSINSTFTYHDAVPDAHLGFQYITPPVDLSPPGSFKSLTLYQGIGVATGFLSDPDAFAYSDIDSMEYWPADTNIGAIPTNNGDRGNVVINNNESIIIGKVSSGNIGGSLHNITGQVDEFATYSVDTKSLSTGPCAQSSAVEAFPGTVLFATSRGIYEQTGTNIPSQVSDRISPVFTKFSLPGKTLALNKITSFNDTYNERILFFISVVPNSGTQYSTEDSAVWAYDYSRAFDGRLNNRWYKWTNVNAAGGWMGDGESVYFIERRLSAFSGLVSTNLYKFNNTKTTEDYEDHSTAIVPKLSWGWISNTFLNQYTGQNEVSATNISARKNFPKMKIVASTAPASSFTVGVSVDENFVDGSAITQATVTVGGLFDDDLIVNLKNNRCFSLRPTFTNTQHKTNWLIEGFEIQATDPSNGAMVR